MYYYILCKQWKVSLSRLSKPPIAELINDFAADFRLRRKIGNLGLNLGNFVSNKIGIHSIDNDAIL